ncbi:MULTISPECIES: cbb3-type cytochrome oxidase assembly protein CcoS [unclassified Modicisalibacter]|uniref:cbb3-type cytochrome oxidase assembly protein CcoS n=1 Tax=unclassified Modicisalibacter TaxID=2679913 RepID=UPI001CCB0239|nr:MULTISPECIES: cbb3-type cytochrome oxidase assembly protein CcoS [unclassified Modicisalibacter]MBZ9559277.1 cbb3-type cytochrome oxidase assembly protein CcoS [Modicisalibacter sp. R2A 31.J]MBZ9576558.1 cbb3-type cytochrome oxidase assembly protein CcoS [Modicisalibacter sp. MOD 31.J]
MSILYLLIPLSLMLLGFAVWAFFWAVRSGQFDDLEGPAHRILFDDDEGDLPAARRGDSNPRPRASGNAPQKARRPRE